jgi:hypothetical protein
MKVGLRRRLTLGFILASGFTGLGQRAAATSPKTSATVTVHVHNLAQVDHKTLMEAEEVATEIFRKAGVESRWDDSAPNSESKQRNSTAQGLDNLSHIQVDILPSVMAERLGRLGLSNDALGLAPGTEPDRQLVYVLYNRVEELGRRQLATRIAPASTAQILGHAIAHEIGHLLLNLKSHSDTGIMRGHWGLKDLQDARCGYLLFTPQQAQAMRAEVRRRIS